MIFNIIFSIKHFVFDILVKSIKCYFQERDEKLIFDFKVSENQVIDIIFFSVKGINLNVNIERRCLK